MKITFQVRFHTEYGQSLFLSGNRELFGNGQFEKAIPLQYLNPELWHITLVLPVGTRPTTPISYHYILRNADGSLAYDFAPGRVIDPNTIKADEVLVVDAWNDAGFFQNPYDTEAFQQVLLKANWTEVRAPEPSPVTHTFKVKAPLLAKGQTLCLLGESDALGRWNTAKPVLLNRLPGETWLSAQVDLSRTAFPLAYKYGLYDAERRAFIRYEEGNNRVLHDHTAPGKHTLVQDAFTALPITPWRGAGVAIPVFSLRSENSFGIGEFADLKPLANWCQHTGLKLIQLLPVNDTTATHTWTDCYPYAAISAFALHPLYLNLSEVVSSQNRSLLEKWEAERQRLNALETVDYEAVLKAKQAILGELYPLEREQTFQSEGYRQFFEQNRHWLAPYAAFCYLRDQYGTADFNQWSAHRQYRVEEVAALTAEGSEAHAELALNYFIQYHLHRQLREATEYAHARGIILKGDIAIGVYRYGADAWQQPELYHLDVQAGAPPDAFAATGQNWGFPTYNWPRMQATGFDWWKQRFEQMAHYFDAFRIDHILGFFRIWSIPLHAVQGIMGCFVPAIPVSLAEFSRRGIRFERERFLKPYITDALLAETFGADQEAVKTRFLHPAGPGLYALRPEFAAQRQVEHYFASADTTESNERLKRGLYDLISNVLLFEPEDPQGQQFHFRFAIEQTSSFKALDAHTQGQLRELYVDYFFRRQDKLWMHEAMQKLPALQRATNMLVCGEDLGLVPACVPQAMKQLGLLSLEVQRMPKALGAEFSRPKDAPYLSVVTPSTHDMSTIRGWWKEDRGITQRFYNRELGRPGPAPDDCPGWVNQAVVQQHLDSPAMWSIFQLQDLLGMDESLRRHQPEAERINNPANPKHYWRYRMHLSLETLLQSQVLNHELNQRVQQSGR